jgi:hypothetical protein
VPLQLFHTEMDSMNFFAQIGLGDQNCKLLERLARLWDSKNMKFKYGDSLISMDGVIVDKDVSLLYIYVSSFVYF